MITNPNNPIPAFLAGGADIVTIHVESCSHLFRTLQTICAAGCKACVALNPVIPVETLREVMHLLDVVLIMGNNPDISGQGWFPEMAAQIRRLARFWEQVGVPIHNSSGQRYKCQDFTLSLSRRNTSLWEWQRHFQPS